MASGTVRELPVYGAIAFGLAVIGARLQTGAATRLIVLTCYLAPTLITLAFGPPYLAAYFMVWLAALLGLIVGSGDVTRWHLGPALRIVLALWTLILAVAWPLVALREFDFAPSAMMSWSVGVNPGAATMGIGNAASIQLVALLGIDWMVGRYAERRDQSFEREIVLSLGIGCLVSIALAIYQATVDIYFLNSAAFSTVGRASGTLRDANPFGVLAALWGPAGAALLLALGITAWMAQVLILVISWLGLWVSGSRNALALAVVGTAVVIWPMWPALSHASRKRLAIVLVAIGAATVMFVRLLHGSMMSPVARFRQIFLAATLAAGGITGFLAHLWDPYGYGLIAGRMIGDFPWFGVGVGSFSLLARDYGRSAGYTGITYDNAQNWFRHQFVEFGVFGSLGWIGWTLMFAYLVVAGRSKPGSIRSVTKIVRLLPVMFVLVSLVGMPAMSAPAAVTFAIFSAWYLLLIDSSGLDGALSWKSSRLWLAMWALVAIFAAGTGYAARHELRGAARAAEFDGPYSYGFYDPESGPEGEYRWVGRRGVIVLEAPKPWMRLTISLEPADGDLRLESLLRNAVLRKALDVRVWRDGEEVLATALHTTKPVTEYVRIPAGRKRTVIETHVSRVVRPADFGLTDSRELGVSVAWNFVDASR